MFSRASACLLGFALVFTHNLGAAETTRESLLVSPKELAAEIAKSTPETRNAMVILDVRRKDVFEKQHIPGSRWADINAWYAKSFEKTGLVDQAHWSAVFGALGFRPDTTIIVAGDSLPNTARAWWLLRYAGFPKAKVLDGGYKAWLEMNLPTEDGAPANDYPITEPEIKFQSQMLVTLDDVTPDAIAASKCRIIDNRSDAEFLGTRGVGTRTGHIPGAVQIEWNRFLSSDGTFLPAEAIQKLLADAKIELEQPLVTHCQTGGRSSVAALALELAGATTVQNYYLGWSEYGGALTAPVEK